MLHLPSACPGSFRRHRIPVAGTCGKADCCVDITGSGTTPGTHAHLWRCGNNASADANERFEWLDYGAVVGVQSGLCLDARTYSIREGEYHSG